MSFISKKHLIFSVLLLLIIVSFIVLVFILRNNGALTNGSSNIPISTVSDGSAISESSNTSGNSNSDGSECVVDSDCVSATCCHSSICVSKNSAPDCKGIMCSQYCKPDSLDCGGSCSCIDGKCNAVFVR
jgi:hypothetical protein